MIRRKFIQLGAISPLFTISGFREMNSPKVQSDTLVEPEKKIPISGEYDVVISGAGPAGVCAAIEAGRTGAKTLLIETQGCLGGVWTAGLLTWILDQESKPGIMREIEKSLKANGGVSENIDTGSPLSFDAEVMKRLLEQMCVDANIDILLHTRVVASITNDYHRLSHVITESKSGREAWGGKIFVDTTGDGDLAALSGCKFDVGRENDHATQPFSLLALVTGINFDDIKEYSRWAGDSKAGSPSKRKLLEVIVQGSVLPSYLKPGLYPIRKDLYMLMANQEYGYSAMNARDVTKATLQARREVNDIVNGLRTVGGAWQNIRLIATAEQIGTREGRRIHGLYTVSKEDLIKGSRFKDAVCRVTFGVDVHSVNKDDEGEVLKKPVHSYNQGVKSKDYDIPLRSLIAKDVGGLMMAGRCISGDFIAHASYRVTGNAVAMGQAAGKTAAVAAQENILPQEVDWQKIRMDG